LQWQSCMDGYTIIAPSPFTADSSTPLLPSGSAGSRGRFGHPRAPTWTFPSTISARQTAYCAPLRKPFVPSIGSSAHIPIAHQPPFNDNTRHKGQQTARIPSLMHPPIDHCQHLLLVGNAPNLPIQRSSVGERVLDKIPHQLALLLVGTQGMRILLADNAILWKRMGNGANNESLGPKVGDCTPALVLVHIAGDDEGTGNGRLVSLYNGPLDLGVIDSVREQTCTPDGQFSYSAFASVRHC
jgi:hypothetical protein